MRTPKVFCILLIMGVLSAACGPLPQNVTINIEVPTDSAPTLDVNQVVAATFQAMTAQAPAATPTAQPATATHAAGPTAAPTSTTGSISGDLNYPGPSIPALIVVAYLYGTESYSSVTTAPGQNTYEIDGLAPGPYWVIAYTVGGGGFPAGLAGGYTQAVICGLGSSCTDHTLIKVNVSAGKKATAADPLDWYAPAGTFMPYPHGGGPLLSTATLPPAVADGGISGSLMYPASGLPSLRIVAFRVGVGGYYYVETALGQNSYEIDHLPPGTYHVVTYVLPGGMFTAGLSGCYSQMVPCGLAYGCNDHTLIDVVVSSAHITTGVDPNDYYADPGSFPPDPVP